MKFGSNKTNRAKYERISMLNLTHETWDEDMYCVMELFLFEENHLIVCTSCIDDDVGHHMVVTWYFMMGGGNLTKQLEVILYAFKRQLWNQTCITYCSKWRKPSLCGFHLEGNRWPCIYFWSCLRRSNIFPVGTVIFPKFHIIFGILESLIFLMN